MSRIRKATAVLQAADKWKQQCLIGGGSILGEENLWTLERFEELSESFVQNLDKGSRSFEEKLKYQIGNTSHEALRLWAEIVWLYWLLMKSVRPETKLLQIRQTWDWTSAEFPETHWALHDVLSHGIVNPGPAYQIQRWRELAFFVSLMRTWFSLSMEDRTAKLEDPWTFADWVDSTHDSKLRQFRHVLLFLIFPDEFEPCVVTNHKQKIVMTYGEEAGQSASVNDVDLIGLDRALLQIRNHLESEHPGEEINFYDSRFREVWSNGEKGPNGDGESDEEWYLRRFGSVDVWLVAAGMSSAMWEEFLELSIFGVPWDFLGDLSTFESREAIHREMVEHLGRENPVNDSLGAWEFLNDVKVDDVLIVRTGLKEILGWGVVRGECAYDSNRATFRNLRAIDWQRLDTKIDLGYQIAVKTLTRFTSYKDTLRLLFDEIDKQAGLERYGPAEALDSLFVEESQFLRILDCFKQRKNLILQGPPGVGKTFVARRIAWCLIGQVRSDLIEMVQFHQSYAYEDFVQGWRPTETGGFTLRNGVFYEFCKKAERQPNVDFVFIIDEINRGNMSRIFGELLMLIESDKRGPQHALSLTYSEAGERFSVPSNVYILGMMNTADRSLAIVDYALRRRFAFETLEPAFGTEKFRAYLIQSNIPNELVDRLDTNLIDLNEQICEHQDLGDGFQIGHSYFVPENPPIDPDRWYRFIIATQIKTLLQEYWFDHPEEVDKMVSRLLE